MVRDFNVKFGCERAEKPTLPSMELLELRLKLIREETTELEEALIAGDLVACADALSDLLYVTHGAGDAFGINLEPCFEEVHRSNMTKLWPDGTVHRRNDGKVIKPDTYSPANLEPIIKAQCRS